MIGLTRIRRMALSIVVGVVALTLSLPSEQQTALQAAPRQVLYLTQSAGFAHDVLDHSEAVLGRIAAAVSAPSVRRDQVGDGTRRPVRMSAASGRATSCAASDRWLS